MSHIWEPVNLFAANLGIQKSFYITSTEPVKPTTILLDFYIITSKGSLYRAVSLGFAYAGEDGVSFTGAVERLLSAEGVNENPANLALNWEL